MRKKYPLESTSKTLFICPECMERTTRATNDIPPVVTCEHCGHEWNNNEVGDALTFIERQRERMVSAAAILYKAAHTDGAHHKQYLINEAYMILTGVKFENDGIAP